MGQHKHIDKRATTQGENAHVRARAHPVLVYDGDCAFCRSCVRALERIRPDAEIVAWQSTDLDELGVTEGQAIDAVQLVQIDGTVSSGHEAIAAMLNTAGPIWTVIGSTVLLPGISWMAAKVYRLIAANRYRLPGSTPACARSSAQTRKASTTSD
jgi:predicted DCC family thiol-disulfide oxidoreductase YuxK